MRVRGDLQPSNAFTLEAQPKNPGFVLVRFFENVKPFEEKNDELTVSGYEYDEYHLELPDAPGIQDDVLNNFDRYIAEAKEREKPSAHGLKLVELKQACNAAITGGVTIETSEGEEHFSLTPEDQINLQNLAFQIAAGAAGVLYHADGKLCRVFTPDEANALTQAAVGHVTYHTTYFNHIKAWVERTEDSGKLDKITYGAKLPNDLKRSFEALLGLAGGSS